MLKKFLIGTIVAVAFMIVGLSTASADCSITTTLKVGSTGTEVSCLQTKVGATADGSFGPMTKASVMAYQASHGLSADGVVGPLSRAVLNASVSPATVTFAPEGCTSASGYSPLLGLAGGLCHVAGTPATGCQTGWLFDPMTGLSCTGSVIIGTLTGGAGEASVVHYATSEKSKIKEGQSDVKVLGFKVEAIDSDIAVNFVKVEVSNTNFAGDVGDPSSEKISNYIDSVDIYKGSTKVGSADLADFSKTTGTGDNPDIYSKTIAVTNATVKEGAKDPFYIAFNAIDSIDSDYMDAVLLTEVASIRVQDGSGAILSADMPVAGITNEVTLEDASYDDAIDLKSSSANPSATTITVNETDVTDEQLALAFKLDVGDKSSDVTLNDMTFGLDVTDYNDGEGAMTSAEQMIDSVVLKMDGQEYPAEIVSESNELDSGSGTVYYLVDLSDSDVVLSAADVVEGKLYITFAEQGGENANYAAGSTVEASIAGEDISASTESDDSFTVEGAEGLTGGLITLSLDAATVSGYKWVTTATGTYVDFEFTVEATDGNFDVIAADIMDSVTGTATITAPGINDEVTDSGLGILTVKTGTSGAYYDATEGGFTVIDGEKVTFRVTYNLDGDNGDYIEAVVTSVAGQTVPDDKQASDRIILNISGN